MKRFSYPALFHLGIRWRDQLLYVMLEPSANFHWPAPRFDVSYPEIHGMHGVWDTQHARWLRYTAACTVSEIHGGMHGVWDTRRHARCLRYTACTVSEIHGMHGVWDTRHARCPRCMTCTVSRYTACTVSCVHTPHFWTGLVTLQNDKSTFLGRYGLLIVHVHLYKP